MQPAQPYAGQSAARPPALSREEEARRDLGSTRIQPGSRVLAIAGFLLLLAAAFLAALVSGQNDPQSSFVKILSGLALPHNGATYAGAKGWLDWVPEPAATRAVEKNLEEHSSLVGLLRPRMQSLLSRFLFEGNEQAVVGRGGWLFFRRDLDYVNGRSFMDPVEQGRRAKADNVDTDPVAAIQDFRAQLAARGIHLVLVPVPVKPCIEGGRFFGAPSESKGSGVRQNAGYQSFLETLRASGTDVFEPAQILASPMVQADGPPYLETDTHWTPQAMEAVARGLTDHLARTLGAPPAGTPMISQASVEISAHGDILALLGLPPDQQLFKKQNVTIHPVSAGNSLWKPSADAEVLLLGDSFSNIYSLEPMGWGEGAGFSEHLSAALGRPLDAILRNSDGAFATRLALQRELAAGRDRLRGKKVVVWEFAARELSFGDWRCLPMQVGKPAAAGFYSVPAGARMRLFGTVSRISQVPRPGSVPYREHIVGMHLVDVREEDAPGQLARDVLAYAWSMRDQKLTTAGRLRPGDRVAITVQPWEDVAEENEKFQRSELEDPALLSEPFHWGEGVELRPAKREVEQAP